MNRFLSMLLILLGPTLLSAQVVPPRPEASQPNQPVVPAPSAVTSQPNQPVVPAPSAVTSQPYQPVVPAPSAVTSQPYRPVVPASSDVNAYGGWSGYSTANTAAGAELGGISQVISAAGQYNLANSAAAVNMTQAERTAIQNQQDWTNAYFSMRAANQANREAEAGSRLTMEQIVRIAQQGIPKPPSPQFLDAVSGRVFWPTALQMEQFGPQREQIEPLVQKRAVVGTLDYDDQIKARQTLNTMHAALKTRIRQIPPQDYSACLEFLRSLMYWTLGTDLG